MRYITRAVLSVLSSIFILTEAQISQASMDGNDGDPNAPEHLNPAFFNLKQSTLDLLHLEQERPERLQNQWRQLQELQQLQSQQLQPLEQLSVQPQAQPMFGGSAGPVKVVQEHDNDYNVSLADDQGKEQLNEKMENLNKSIEKEERELSELNSEVREKTIVRLQLRQKIASAVGSNASSSSSSSQLDIKKVDDEIAALNLKIKEILASIDEKKAEFDKISLDS